MRELRTYVGLLAVLCIACLGFLAFVYIGRNLGVQEATLATICSAAALFTGALVAFRAFQLNRRTVQEPWSVVFRELHKEFWNDPDLAKVRAWLCSNEAYESELLPVLEERKAKTAGTEAHTKLEALDKYCALLVRVHHLPTSLMTEDQLVAYKALGYDWWMYKTTLRREISEYIKDHWRNLHPLLPRVPPQA